MSTHHPLPAGPGSSARPLRDDNGDYPYPAPESLTAGVALVGHFVEQLTGDDLCNTMTSSAYTGPVFVLRGYDDFGDAPNFVFHGTGDVDPYEVGWYKENGRSTTTSRLLTDAEVLTSIAACLADLPVSLDDVDELFVYGHRPDQAGAQAQEFLTAARHWRAK